MFGVVELLEKKEIGAVEMFNACDVNEDRRIEVKELAKFLEGISADLKIKEAYAFMKYMDIDKNGVIDKDEFLRMFAKAENQY